MQKFQAVLEYAFRESDNNLPLPPLLSQDVNSLTVLYFIHYDSLLQNVTDIIMFFITKFDFYYKLRQYTDSFLITF